MGLGKPGGRLIWSGAETLSWRCKLVSSPSNGESQGDELEIWSLLYASATLFLMKSWWTIWGGVTKPTFTQRERQVSFCTASVILSYCPHISSPSPLAVLYDENSIFSLSKTVTGKFQEWFCKDYTEKSY